MAIATSSADLQFLQNLLTHNDPPTEDQIRQLLVARDADREILSHATGKQNASKRSKAKLRLEKYDTVLHPIRKTPIEILCKIFLMVAADSKTPIRVMARPWMLSQVCRFWRDICFAFAKLWSRIDLRNDDFGWTDDGSHLKWDRRRGGGTSRALLLKQHLDNSREYPLTVSLCCIPPLLGSNPTLTTLLPTSERWRTLSVMLHEDTFAHMVQIRGHLDLLHSLVLDTIYYRAYMTPFTFRDADVANHSKFRPSKPKSRPVDYTFSIPRILTDVPNLRHLSAPRNLLSLFIFPMKDIIHYEEDQTGAQHPRHPGFEKIIAMEKITRLKLVFHNNPIEQINLGVILAHLRCLELDLVMASEQNLWIFTNQLVCPKLEFLHIEIEGRLVDEMRDCFGLFGKFGKSLQHLSINIYSFQPPTGNSKLASFGDPDCVEEIPSPSPQQIIGLLHQLPLLQTLYVPCFISLCHDIIIALKDPKLCPDLKRIYTRQKVKDWKTLEMELFPTDEDVSRRLYLGVKPAEYAELYRPKICESGCVF